MRNAYKVKKLNQLIQGWINYFKIGSMKGLCGRLDGQIRYRLRMCIWKHWKTPKNKEKNLVKLGVPRWAAHKVANTGNRIAHMCHNGWVQKAISNKRLAEYGPCTERYARWCERSEISQLEKFPPTRSYLGTELSWDEPCHWFSYINDRMGA